MFDHEIADVAAVSAGNDYEIGNMIADSLSKVGKMGVVRIEKGRSTESTLQIAKGMQYDRGYLSPYFVTDRRNMTVEFENCKILLVDKKITNAKEIRKQLEIASKGKYSLLIVAEDIEQDALAPIIKNKLKGVVKVAATKAPEFGERKSHCLDDIAILTGGIVVREAMGLTLESTGKEVLGSAVKVVITKESTLIVTDGKTQKTVEKRIAQLEALIENTEEHSKKKVLKERVAKLSAGIAIIKVGALTDVELKDKTLRIEDALNSAKAAIEEGVVVGGGCCLLRLSMKVDSIKKSLQNEEQKIGADIFKKALSYPLKLIAQNAGENGSMVVQKILSVDDSSFGYNAAKDCYEDLMFARILDPTKVVRCCLEHAASVAKIFMLSDVAVVDSTDLKQAQVPRRRPPRPFSNFRTWQAEGPLKRPKIKF